MKRRVVITGVGIVSCIGNTYDEILNSLQKGLSGIQAMPKWKELGLKSAVAGKISQNEIKKRKVEIPKKYLNCMSNVSLFCTLAAKDAIEDSGLTKQMLASDLTGCIVGSGIGNLVSVYEGGVKLYSQRAHRINPYTTIRVMANTCSANIATFCHLGGRSYSISSACATSLHNIGHAFELISGGQLDIAVTGGGDEINELTAGGFCSLRMALSVNYNDDPKMSSRPYDNDRDGFVLSEGAAIVILENLDHAKARGAKIYGEIIGFGANCDGYDMVLPEPEGRQAANCVKIALKNAGIDCEEIDYINAHGTSTVAGDLAEIKALRRVFTNGFPLISSTKSMGGHSLGAVGAQEVIHCLAMMENNFIAPTINLEKKDNAFDKIPIVHETLEKRLTSVISNSFGFGGTNAAIVLRNANI